MSTKAIRSSNGFFDPFRPEHYADPEIRKTYSDDFLTVHRKSMETAIPDFYVRGKGEYFEALRTNLDLAARGVLSAGEALNVAAAQWSQITNKLGPAEQARQWRSIKAEYPAPIRKLLS
jgi:multiple sugar transport system substrate-binding protein